MEIEEKDSYTRRLLKEIVPSGLDGYLYDEEEPLKKLIPRLQYVLDGRNGGATGGQVTAIHARGGRGDGRPPTRERGQGANNSLAPRPPPRGSSPRSPVCWACGDRGHMRDQCPLPETRRCYACGSCGHLRRECPRSGKNGARPPAATGASGEESWRRRGNTPGGRHGPAGGRQRTREWERTGAVPRRSNPPPRREGPSTETASSPPTDSRTE